MNIKETIELVTYSIKKYRDQETKRGFTLLEYYSVSDLSVRSLAKEAKKIGMISSAAAILNFQDENFWNLMELNMEDRLKNFHSFNGVELTKDDKLSIYERLSSKGYPLQEGVYDREAYLYANGFDFTKEEMKERIVDAYNKAHPSKMITAINTTKEVKVLKK